MLKAEINDISSQGEHETSEAYTHFQGVIREKESKVSELEAAIAQATAKQEDQTFLLEEEHGLEVLELEKAVKMLQHSEAAAQQRYDALA
jgi:hypothetical protein